MDSTINVDAVKSLNGVFVPQNEDRDVLAFTLPNGLKVGGDVETNKTNKATIQDIEHREAPDIEHLWTSGKVDTLQRYSFMAVPRRVCVCDFSA